MGLIFHKRVAMGDRSHWSLSFSGASFSHKRGWLTLNSRGRSSINLPGPLFTFRVGKTGTALWLIAFLLFDLAVLLVKLVFLPPALLIDGVHEVVTNDEKTASGVSLIIAGLALFALFYFAYAYFMGGWLPF